MLGVLAGLVALEEGVDAVRLRGHIARKEEELSYRSLFTMLDTALLPGAPSGLAALEEAEVAWLCWYVVLEEDEVVCGLALLALFTASVSFSMAMLEEVGLLVWECCTRGGGGSSWARARPSLK